jgi:hypothetical protein
MNRQPAKKHSSTAPPDRLKHRWEAWLLALILVFVWTPRSFGWDRVDFYFATIENTSTGMHAKESRLALLTIMQKIFSHKYPEIRLHLDFLARDADLADTIRTKQYDVIATTGLDYLELMKQIRLRPLAILSKTDQPVGAFMLITDKNKTLDTLKKIPERTLILEAGGRGDIAKLWMDTLLQARGLPKHNLFFDILRTGNKPSRILLPVFFGQADACIVSEDAFEVMSELNPQLKEQLVVQQRSPGFVNLLISATDRLEDWARDIVIEETERMNTSPDGQQILTTIQMKRFFTFKPEYLEDTERIYQSQRRSGGGN